MYGDLFEIMCNHGAMPQKLARTLFHQFVDGLEHMHSQRVAHMDLKLENLLISEDFTLKITDFDLSMKIGEETFSKHTGRGTSGYRAPEVKNETCVNLQAADIYSLGVILFVLVSGSPPYNEVETSSGHEFDKYYQLLREDPIKFWRIQDKFRPGIFSSELKNFFCQLISERPRSRPTLEEIRGNEWFKGETFDTESLKEEMKKYLGVKDDN